MEMEILKDVEILFGLALMTVLLFRKLLIPSIVGFLAAGVLAGPHALGIIGNAHDVEKIAEIGVVLLLFTIGIELSLKELMKIRHLLVWGGGVQVSLTIAAVAAASLTFGFSIQQSIFLGFLVALSSTAIVMKLLIDAGATDSPHGRLAMGILIFQDLCIVPMVLLTPMLSGSGGGLSDILIVGAKTTAVVIAAHYGSRFLVPWIFRQVVRARSRELFILTIIFIGLGTAWLTSLAGLSLALGAFIAGLAISESEYSHQALSDIIPFREAFMSLFFISVGMLLDPAILIDHPVWVGVLIITILAVKTLVTSLAAWGVGIPLRTGIITALSISQIGEFSFVLSQGGVSTGLLPPDLYQAFLAASIATMGATPFLMRFAEPLAEGICRLFPRSVVQGRGVLATREKPLRIENHTIIVGFGVNGKNVARVLKTLAIDHLVIETNPFTVRRESRKGVRIVFGDASNPEILSHAGIERARTMVIAISDASASRRVTAQARRMNPLLHIIVRTRYLLEVEPLFRIGANEVVPEEFETSVEILSLVLRTYLIPHDDIEKCVADIRKDGYAMFRKMSRAHSHATGIGGFLSGAEIATFRVGAGSLVDGTSLREGIVRARSGASILTIKRGNELVPNPDPIWELKSDDILLLLGTPEQLAAAAPLFDPVRRGKEP